MTRCGFRIERFPLPVLACLWGAMLSAMIGCTPEARNETADADFTHPELAGGDLVVATVAGKPITAGYIVHKMRIQYPEMEREGPAMVAQAREVLRRIIEEHCFTTVGEERGYDEGEEFLRVLNLSRSHILTNATSARVISARAIPNEEEIQAFYDERSAQYVIEPQVWWHHILRATEAEAWDIHTRLTAGEDFEALAREHSLDEQSAARGGQMPPMTKTHVAGSMGPQPDLGAALFTMNKDEISKPIATGKGWHVVRCDARREEIRRSLDEVRDRIIGKIATTRRRDLRIHVLDSLKLAYEVAVFEDVFEQFYFAQMSDSLPFEVAQQIKESDAKLKHYNQILERFPDSRFAPEALFMVGFVHAEETKDLAAARGSFEEFLQRYPDHEMAASARLMMTELDQTPSTNSPGGDSEAQSD